MEESILTIIRRAVEEDIPKGDVTSDALFGDEESEAVIVAKQDGIICGIDIAEEVFKTVDDEIEFKAVQAEGAFVEEGNFIAFVQGRTRSLLKAERTALNFLQRMSGIATATRAYREKIKHTEAKILDSRKTAPTLRMIDKLAVYRAGGGNHRFSLSDRSVIKDNHLEAAGSITKAVARVRESVGEDFPISVEVESIEQFEEAQKTSAERIVLDDVPLDFIKTCVENNTSGKELEVGGAMIDMENVTLIAEAGVDYISVGEITHSVKAFRMNMKFTFARTRPKD